MVSEETERGWTGKLADNEGLVFAREKRGVSREAHTLDRHSWPRSTRAS